ncbi:hypothetical protein [Lentzea atacamensis]|uniref:hypothetical protein n=1 Tax=Lentzea atacamensis TaxID=531938 RepID=UPI001B872CC6|nr:hypothetical protein [Lentzea atacamensis]
MTEMAEPRERLRTLFRIAITEDPTSGLEPALVADADDPVVAPILHRVTQRRVARSSPMDTPNSARRPRRHGTKRWSPTPPTSAGCSSGEPRRRQSRRSQTTPTPSHISWNTW